MNSDWNTATAHMVGEIEQGAMSTDLPVEVSTLDVDAYLDKIYALATQI